MYFFPNFVWSKDELQNTQQSLFILNSSKTKSNKSSKKNKKLNHYVKFRNIYNLPLQG